MTRPLLLAVLLLALGGPAAAEPLGKGDPVPDFALVDSGGRTVHLREFRGKAVLVTFVYTQCPVPTLCPRLMGKMAQVQQLVELVPELRDRFQVLSITLDPERDTPERLAEYAKGWNATSSNWRFLTGPTDRIREVAGYFGVTFVKEGDGLVIHNARTALLGPDGRLDLVLSGSDWKPGELAATVRELLAPTE